jgi:hypothetical protein
VLLLCVAGCHVPVCNKLALGLKRLHSLAESEQLLRDLLHDHLTTETPGIRVATAKPLIVPQVPGWSAV